MFGGLLYQEQCGMQPLMSGRKDSVEQALSCGLKLKPSLTLRWVAY